MTLLSLKLLLLINAISFLKELVKEFILVCSETSGNSRSEAKDLLLAKDQTKHSDPLYIFMDILKGNKSLRAPNSDQSQYKTG